MRPFKSFKAATIFAVTGVAFTTLAAPAMAQTSPELEARPTTDVAYAPPLSAPASVPLVVPNASIVSAFSRPNASTDPVVLSGTLLGTDGKSLPNVVIRVDLEPSSNSQLAAGADVGVALIKVGETRTDKGWPIHIESPPRVGPFVVRGE